MSKYIYICILFVVSPISFALAMAKISDFDVYTQAIDSRLVQCQLTVLAVSLIFILGVL